ncbi:archaellin/type IV pilin N-terminal domain-containing protein [Halobacteriaceae archaeon SHR40]|uniref:archaellin/type IV pilin N-terminal domain-containing protein n=1 Tax=Halovenus amylolytica TaxID=2500550 RepID=UPI000FE3F4B8
MKGYIKRNERGQVGIGTLIVFIALVLVAAIAAGVLINTAGFLQTQAEQTGEESSSQVANNINIIGEVGVVSDASNGEINQSKLTVQRSPGSDNVDLTELSIQYVGDNGFENLVHNSSQTDNESSTATYGITQITAESDDAVMTDDADRYQIVIPFAGTYSDGTVVVDDANEGAGLGLNSADLSVLKAGQEAELEITTADRATRNAFLQAPDTLDVDDGDTIGL